MAITTRTSNVALLALALAGTATRGQDPVPPVPAPEVLREEVDALWVRDVPWRRIPWRTCLLEGLREARASKRPVILWVFIDRPVDDKRC